MSETQQNGPIEHADAVQKEKSGDTITISCDHFFEFVENESQPADAWPFPEPPFIPDAKPAKPKS